MESSISYITENKILSRLDLSRPRKVLRTYGRTVERASTCKVSAVVLLRVKLVGKQ